MSTVLDWRDSAHWSPQQESCVHCKAPTNLRDGAGRAAHKACVERLIDARRHLKVAS